MSFLTQFAFWKTMVIPKRFSHDKIPDLTGKVAIVTGANSGLGYATTVALAGNGAHVFMACRSKDRAFAAIEKAKKEIKQKYPQAAEPKLEFLELDLSDINKSKRAADAFLETGQPLHILVNNSGLGGGKLTLSADGIEQIFAVSHLGHFVFTLGLLDRIKESQPSRIVMLSSSLHEHTVKGGIDFETLNDDTKSDPHQRYGRSKLAPVLFGKALARRLGDEKVFVNAAHPGFVSTEMTDPKKASFGRIGKAIFGFFVRNLAVTADIGALTQLHLATSPEIENKAITGGYFIPIGHQIQPSKYARDEQLQEKLWTWSEETVRKHLKAK
ncbi:hypothetical protein BGZ83_002198 [Gryganskiella cystojenkinii]|nr:hypothetical protein BGZ83_002198 [Gryganskiella cystojenkinii]